VRHRPSPQAAVTVQTAGGTMSQQKTEETPVTLTKKTWNTPVIRIVELNYAKKSVSPIECI
jgi:hypothetical protein